MPRMVVIEAGIDFETIGKKTCYDGLPAPALTSCRMEHIRLVANS